MGHTHETHGDAAAWLLVWESAIRKGNRREEREARVALARLGAALIVDSDSPLRFQSKLPAAEAHADA
jgi:hypothetical protein